MDNKALDLAAREAGIACGFTDAHGQQQTTSSDTKRKLLDAMAFPRESPDNPSPLPSVKVFTTGSPLTLPLRIPREFHWALQQEDGVIRQGETGGDRLLVLPEDLPQGYHRLTLSDEQQQWSCRIIVAPRRCYEPAPLLAGKKTVGGLCSALYPALRKKLGGRRFW